MDRRIKFLCFLLVVLLFSPFTARTMPVSREAAESIACRVWHNECRGTIEGLTSWNAGEAFASLGIAHFIWYPENENGVFQQSFPELLKFMELEGVKLPK